MACLLPQFKCDTPLSSTALFKTLSHPHHHLFKTRYILSMTPIVDMESLRLPSLEPHSPKKVQSNFEATLATEALITGEEATIAAAAAEAVALAKAALETAHDVASMVRSNPSAKSVSIPTNFQSETHVFRFNKAHLSNIDTNSEQFPLFEFDELDTTNDGWLSTSTNVRSRRQIERKARRVKAIAKAGATVVSVKSGSNKRKKRTSQHVDYSDPLHYLRATTTTSRLLTATEELQLSEGIQDMLKLEKLQEEVAERCEGQPTFAQWATAAGIDQKALRKRLNYGMLCKDKMVKSNIRLVISIAKNYQGAGMNLQDLVQEGCRGLVKSTEKFDASKGFKFSTYAHWWIRQAVRKSLSDRSRTIRLPFHMVEATYRVKEAKKQLYNKNGRQPTNEEIAEATGLSMKRLTAVLVVPKAPRSLDQKIGFNMNLKPSEVTSDPNAETSEDLLMKEFMKQDLEKVLDSLSPRENQVIRYRFGLQDGRMRTLQEIGELIGVSRERIRQIESCAFRKLKNKRRTKNLQQYLIS